jgi:hypothetical protein
MLVQDVINHLLNDVEPHVLDVRRGLAAIALTSGTEIHLVRRQSLTRPGGDPGEDR